MQIIYVCVSLVLNAEKRSGSIFPMARENTQLLEMGEHTSNNFDENILSTPHTSATRENFGSE